MHRQIVKYKYLSQRDNNRYSAELDDAKLAPTMPENSLELPPITPADFPADPTKWEEQDKEFITMKYLFCNIVIKHLLPQCERDYPEWAKVREAAETLAEAVAIYLKNGGQK